MAKKVVFNEFDILEKTKEFVELYGIENLSARNLASHIGCSTQPLFRNFKNMDDLKSKLRLYINDIYVDFINNIVDKNDNLFTTCYSYVLFALKKPNLFNALFMSNLSLNKSLDEVLKSSLFIDTIHSITKEYGLTLIQSEKLYRDVRFYSHGLACQLACKNIILSENEIKRLIRNVIYNLKVTL